MERNLIYAHSIENRTIAGRSALISNRNLTTYKAVPFDSRTWKGFRQKPFFKKWSLLLVKLNQPAFDYHEKQQAGTISQPHSHSIYRYIYRCFSPCPFQTSLHGNSKTWLVSELYAPFLLMKQCYERNEGLMTTTLPTQVPLFNNILPISSIYLWQPQLIKIYLITYCSLSINCGTP